MFHPKKFYNFHILYRITNQISGKFYIGTHSTNSLYDGYFGSGRVLKKAIKKHGKSNFCFEILKIYSTRQEMLDMEIQLIDISMSLFCYNVDRGGKGGKFENSVESRKKMSETHKAKGTIPPSRLGISPTNKGVSLSEETKKKISETLKIRGIKPPSRFGQPHNAWNKGMNKITMEQYIKENH